jgi:hypothetical protein
LIIKEKRRQQGRGKTGKQKDICPTCKNEYLKNSMEWRTVDGKRKLCVYGRHCPSCTYDERK